MNTFGYRSALVFIAVLTAINLVFYFLTGFNSGVAVHIGAGFIVGIGIWLQSKFFRYVGVLWAAGSIASVAWPIFSSQKPVWSYALIWLLLFAVLSILILCNLLFSSRFSREFAEELENQPDYKRTLWKIFIAVLVVAAAIATANDIYNLATS